MSGEADFGDQEMERFVPFMDQNWDRRSHGTPALPDLHRPGRSLGDPLLGSCGDGLSTRTRPSGRLSPSGHLVGNGFRPLNAKGLSCRCAWVFPLSYSENVASSTFYEAILSSVEPLKK